MIKKINTNRQKCVLTLGSTLPIENNFGSAMCYFTTNLAKYLNYVHGQINHAFGHRYYATLIESDRYLVNVIRYIYQNPVRAKMVKNVGDYPYSTYGIYSGIFNSKIQVIPDHNTRYCFKNGIDEWYEWSQIVNQNFNENDLIQIRQSLGKARFELTKRQLLKIDLKTTSLTI